MLWVGGFGTRSNGVGGASREAQLTAWSLEPIWTQSDTQGNPGGAGGEGDWAWGWEEGAQEGLWGEIPGL